MYQALYRKYRPKTFDDVVGQNVIIKTLTNSIMNNKITHAYLFTGPRGTGKTSIAKIMAKIVNCDNLNGVEPCNKCVSCTQTQSTDIIEIDAASNNGVDEIRELRDKVNLVPSYGKYKVYIIDEVHMLTTAAFNALLKTLEEPPKHIIFILATTEPHKIPATILSRCQRYDFKKISIKEITKRLEIICKSEKIKIEDSAIELIAKLSDGGMRDSIGLLDQLTAYTDNKITVNDVHDVYGTITKEEISDFLTKLFDKDINSTLELINKYDDDGKNLNKIIENFIEFLKNLLIFDTASEYFTSEEEKSLYSKLCEKTNENEIYKIIEILLELLNMSKGTNNVKLSFELALIKIMNLFNIKAVTIEKTEKIPVLEIPKKIEVKSTVEVKPIDNEVKVKIENLKDIRVNNTLAKFDKKQLLSFKKEIDLIKELLMDPKYSSMVSLILDGELKAKGDNNLIFVYKVKTLEECFNSSLKEIEKVFEKQFKANYKPIAVTNEDWEIIKVEFNKSIKNNQNIYEYKEETISLDEIYKNKKKTKKQASNNEIEDIFEEVIVYN